MAHYSEGDKVSWPWGNGRGRGVIQSVFPEKTIRTIDGTEVVRKGTKENPAYYIAVDEGNNVLKLHSEVDKE